MYNRYIPQSDGTFQRNRVPELRQPPKPAPPPPPPPKEHDHPPVEKEFYPPPRHPAVSQSQSMGITNFFRQLLPKNLDTADLLIILLLLLMAGDNEEEKTNALLTMALYFLM